MLLTHLPISPINHLLTHLFLTANHKMAPATNPTPNPNTTHLRHKKSELLSTETPEQTLDRLRQFNDTVRLAQSVALLLEEIPRSTLENVKPIMQANEALYEELVAPLEKRMMDIWRMVNYLDSVLHLRG